MGRRERHVRPRFWRMSELCEGSARPRPYKAHLQTVLFMQSSCFSLMNAGIAGVHHPLTHLAFILFLMSDYFFTPNGGMGHSLHMCGAQEFFSPSSMWVLKDPTQVVRLPSDHLYPPTLPAAPGSTLSLSLLFALRH